MGRKVRRMKSAVSDGEVREESAAKYGGHLNGEAGGIVRCVYRSICRVFWA